MFCYTRAPALREVSPLLPGGASGDLHLTCTRGGPAGVPPEPMSEYKAVCGQPAPCVLRSRAASAVEHYTSGTRLFPLGGGGGNSPRLGTSLIIEVLDFITVDHLFVAIPYF